MICWTSSTTRMVCQTIRFTGADRYISSKSSIFHSHSGFSAVVTISFNLSLYVKRSLKSSIRLQFVSHIAWIRPLISPSSFEAPSIVRNAFDNLPQLENLNPKILFFCASVSWFPYTSSTFSFRSFLPSPNTVPQNIISSIIFRCSSVCTVSPNTPLNFPTEDNELWKPPSIPEIQLSFSSPEITPFWSR